MCDLRPCYLWDVTVIYSHKNESEVHIDMKKQTLTKKQQKALLDIAKRLMVEVENRGDLEARGCDSEDFIEVPVWGIQKAMEEAYLLGRAEK